MTISVKGKAMNAKAGAVVTQENDHDYYIEELHAWPDSAYGKTVEVTGTLHIQTFTEEDLKDEEGNWKQGMLGDQYIIRNAKWKLAD
jgi:hypothetical protein